MRRPMSNEYEKSWLYWQARKISVSLMRADARFLQNNASSPMPYAWHVCACRMPARIQSQW
jgi:hypothetical protein